MPEGLENELDLDDPIIKSARKFMLERIAEEEDSGLYCPKCKTHLPRNPMTCGAKIPDGVNANLEPVYRRAYFCTLCQVYFDDNTKEILKV